MTQAEGILRKSLDEINRMRKFQAVAFVILAFTVMCWLVWLGRVGASPVIDVGKTIVVAACFVVFLMTYVGMAIAMVVTKMTTKLLSAIELVSKGGVPPTVPNDQGQNVLTPVRDRIASDQFTLKEEGRKGFRPGCSFIRNRCVVGQARAGQRCRE